jgi:transcription initiation factor TFIID subunit 10
MASDAPENTDSKPVTQNGHLESREVTDGPNPPPPELAAGHDPRLPTQKDTSLREFVNKIDDYAPIVRLWRAGCIFYPGCSG